MATISTVSVTDAPGVVHNIGVGVGLVVGVGVAETTGTSVVAGTVAGFAVDGGGLDGALGGDWQPAPRVNARNSAVINTAGVFMSAPPISDARS